MDMTTLQQPVKAAFCYLLIITAAVLHTAPAYSDSTQKKLTPKWTERYLFKNNPELVKDTHLDHVLSFYYFGRYKDFTIMGMERVKGENYHQHNTVLIFKNGVLKGYYEDLQVFPSGVSKAGIIEFPANNKIADHVNLKEGYYPAIIFSREKRLNPEGYAVNEIEWVDEL